MTDTNRLTGFTGWLRRATSNSPLLCRLSIHRRLTVCFVLVIVLMLLGEGALLRQLHLIRAQADRLDGLTEELIEVQRVHTSLASLYGRPRGSPPLRKSFPPLSKTDEHPPTTPLRHPPPPPDFLKNIRAVWSPS